MNNNTSRLNLSEMTSNEDVFGAIIYIIVVLLWYSLSIVFLMGMETIKSNNETIVESERHSKRLFTRSFRERTNTKKILEELVDKKKRDKLWDIYLDKSKDMKDQLNQAEKLRIRNIRRQIATINAYNRGDHILIEKELGSSAPNIIELEKPARVRRQLSDDRRILEPYRETVDDTRINENWPWAIQKLMIRRQLHRQRAGKNYLKLRKLSVP